MERWSIGEVLEGPRALAVNQRRQRRCYNCFAMLVAQRQISCVISYCFFIVKCLIKAASVCARVCVCACACVHVHACACACVIACVCVCMTVDSHTEGWAPSAVSVRRRACAAHKQHSGETRRLRPSCLP